MYVESIWPRPIPQENGDVRRDLFSSGKVWYKHKPEVIFHLAAQPSVQWSVDNPSEALSHNVLGTSRVLEFAKQVNCRRVIFASSAAAHRRKGTSSKSIWLTQTHFRT